MQDCHHLRPGRLALQSLSPDIRANYWLGYLTSALRNFTQHLRDPSQSRAARARRNTLLAAAKRACASSAGGQRNAQTNVERPKVSMSLILISALAIVLLTALAIATSRKDRLLYRLRAVTSSASESSYLHRIQTLDRWSIALIAAFILLGIAFNLFVYFLD